MTLPFHVPKWIVEEAQSVLADRASVVAAMCPRMIRVRRRGFRASVKRGDLVKHDGKTWNVARRSNWNLWLYEHVEMKGEGATISVRLPKRFEVH